MKSVIRYLSTGTQKMKMQVSFCVGCKKNTETVDAKLRKTKNNRLMVSGSCKACGRKKSTFVKKGAGIINNLLNSGKLPELHLPGHQFTGPGTKLKERLLRGDKPINKLDAAAREHDMMYNIFKDTKERHVFDKKLQDQASAILKDPQSTIKERLEAGLVSGIMLGKRKLGMGKV